MSFSAGFDTKYYPGASVMTWLAANTNLKWCGYYLAPAPNRSDTGWPGQFTSLRGTWGVAPIYVGQQDPNTATASYTPSSILTASQGTIDGNNAAALAGADGFPNGSYIYVDWEQGDLNASGATDYLTAWVNAVVADGRYKPAFYCSHVIATQIVALLDAINPTPLARLWCWNISNPAGPVFNGDITNVPTADPTGCGAASAIAWQYSTNQTVALPTAAGAGSLILDTDTASTSDPGAP
jgi:hypothetical protein